jgi:hypothetical protein
MKKELRLNEVVKHLEKSRKPTSMPKYLLGSLKKKLEKEFDSFEISFFCFGSTAHVCKSKKFVRR